MGIPYFLTVEGNEVKFNGEGTLAFFVPVNYLDKGYVKSVGENVSMFGVFDYAIYDKDGKVEKSVDRINLPTVFMARPSNMESLNGVRLRKNSPVQDYKVYKFSKGDLVVVSKKVPQSINNAEIMFKIMINGNLPNSVPYDLMHEYWINTMALNGTSFGINNQIFGIFSTEIFRDSEDISRPFRLSKSKDMSSYKQISIKDIPKLVNAFTSFTSENFDESIVYGSMNKTKRDVPLEKIMMM